MESLLVTQAINVAYEVLILAVLVLGLAVVMGLLNVLNIAHGEFVMLGAYAAYMVQKAGFPYLTAVPTAAVVIVGVAIVGDVARTALPVPVVARPPKVPELLIWICPLLPPGATRPAYRLEVARTRGMAWITTPWSSSARMRFA